MGRVRLLLACAVLVVPGVSACGDDGTESGGDATETPVVIEELVSADALAVAEAIVADLGPEPAMVAVGYALDRGHTAAQIVAAASERSLRADGTIDGVSPELVSWGLFADLPVVGPAGLRSVPRGGASTLMITSKSMPLAEITAADWLTGLAAEFDAVVSGRSTVSAPSAGRIITEPLPPDDGSGEMATIMIGAVVELSAQGYSAEQIITGILLGEMGVSVVASGWGPIGCWQLRSSADGSVIRPSSPPLDGVLEGTTTCRAALDDMAEAETDIAPVEPTPVEPTPVESAPVEPTPVEPTPDLSAYSGVYLGVYPGASVDQDGNIVQRVDGELRITVDPEGYVEGTFAYALANAETSAIFTGEVSQDGDLTAAGTATTTLANGREVSGPIVLEGKISGATFEGVSRSATGREVPITATRL